MSGNTSNTTYHYANVAVHGPGARIEKDACKAGIVMVGVSGGTFSNLTGIQEATESNEIQPSNQLGTQKNVHFKL